MHIKLDDNIKSVCIPINQTDLAYLQSEEIELANKFRNKSAYNQFIAGRCAARMAILEITGEKCPAILRNKSGSPIWPDNIVGSISHSSEYAVAAVSQRSKFRSIGIDIENSSRNFNLKISNKILVQSENEWVLQDSKNTKQRLLSVFSAKEAFYKALSPIGAPVFWFQDVTLSCTSEDKDGYIFLPKVLESILESCNIEVAPSVKCYINSSFIISLCSI